MPSDPGHFVWYELITSDVAGAAGFYGEVIGWGLQRDEKSGSDYHQWTLSGQAIGGLLALSREAAAEGLTPVWLGYVSVPDVDKGLAAIVAAGGQVQMPARDIPGIGRIAMVADPQGAVLYIMAPTGEGRSTSFSPGKPGHGGWNELHTSDWSAAVAFYAEQFGWAKSEAMDMGPLGTYQLFNNGGDAIGGMRNNLDFDRPRWLFYFNVRDIDQAAVRIAAAGGQILNGPHGVPGGDLMIQASDPQGAMFAVVGPRVS